MRALKEGVAYGSGSVALMAIGIVMVKPILETHSFLWTVGLRLLAGAVCMIALVAVAGSWRSVAGHYRSPQPWPTVILGSLLGSYISMILWLAGYKLTDASVAAVLNETAGAFIVLFAWLILKEEMNAKRLAGVALAFFGVAVVVMV